VAADSVKGTPEPHEVQREALRSLRDLRNEGERQALAVLAPGLGKTYLAAFDIEAFEEEIGRTCRVLYLAHRAPILDQAERSLRAVLGVQRTYGQHVGQRRDENADVLAASFQSFQLAGRPAGHFDYVVVDEAHHTPAPTYQALVSSLRPAFRLGLTATPFRGDGQDVLEAYGDNVAISMPLERALATGRLTPIDYRVYADALDPNSLRGLLRGGAARRRATTARSDREIVDAILREAQVIDGRRRILIFCADLEQMRRFARLFDDAETVCGDDTRVQQLSKIERFSGGNVEILLSRDVLNEGLDVPDASTIVFLRNTESPVVFLQQLGRGLREAPGKHRVVVLDFVANLERIEFLYSFHSRLTSAQRTASAGRTSIPRSSLYLDATAQDVVRELVRKKMAAQYLVGVDGLCASFDFRVSGATIRRLVALERLVPDVIVPGTEDPLFDRATVRQLHRLVRTGRMAEGLVSESAFARAIGQPPSWVRRMEGRGFLPAAWVHVNPSGRVQLYFELADVDAHRQRG
jgi:superfamily II DNA or RNA helicase